MKSFIQLNIIILSAFLLMNCSQKKTDTINLSGKWFIKLDPSSVGIEKEWFSQTFSDTIQLPGCLQAQGYGGKPSPNTKWWAKMDLSERHPSMEKYGKDDDNFKLQQFLMPRNHYIGAAWYQRDIEIPKYFDGKHMTLTLERCHWESQVWVDGINLGKNQSLATAHVYDLSKFSAGKHVVSIRIDNSEIVSVGKMSHSVSDQTAGTWNGIVGEIALKAMDGVYIQNVRTYPDIQNKSIRIIAEIANPENMKGNFGISAEAKGYNNGNNHSPKEIEKEIQLNGESIQTVELNYVLGEETKLWDEFDPNLYKLNIQIEGTSFQDGYATTFGMRQMTTNGKYFFVNGTKTYLRGNVDCAVNPRTAYAPMTVERWKEIFQEYKNFGLNHVRFHSWCPPKQAFIAADEMGVYLAPEVHEWSWVKKDKSFEFFKEESKKILKEYSMHPSFVMMGLGNESGIEESAAQELLDQWKTYDNTRLFTIKASDASHQGFPENMDYEILGHVKDKKLDKGRIRTRYQAFWPPLPENSEFCTLAPQTTIDWSEGISLYDTKYKNRPLIAHETGQFCAYPDVFNEMKKYTGYLRPTYLEVAAEQLEERGMTNQLPDFVRNSGKWQVLLTREEIEGSLRTPGLAGFQWLALNDFTGQNTAPVGFTDAFYEPKSYVKSEAMRRFCAPTVLLARLPKRVFTTSETLTAEFEVAHFGKEQLDLNDFKVVVRDDLGKVIKEQHISGGKFGQGNVQKIGTFSMPLAEFQMPKKYNLEISSAQNKLVNDYDFWVYPETKASDYPSDIIVAYQWNKETLKALNDGKTVLLLPEMGTLKGNLPSCFTTFYWTSFGEKGGQSSACGIMMDNKHPLFKDFPTETHANWQWWELLSKCQPMILDQFKEAHPWQKSYVPLIQPIDSWKLNRKLGLVVEAKVGNGKVLICSMDIESDLLSRPVARQFRESLIHYLQSSDFKPQIVVKPVVISTLFDQSKPEIKQNLQGLPTDG